MFKHIHCSWQVHCAWTAASNVDASRSHRTGCGWMASSQSWEHKHKSLRPCVVSTISVGLLSRQYPLGCHHNGICWAVITTASVLQHLLGCCRNSACLAVSVGLSSQQCLPSVGLFFSTVTVLTKGSSLVWGLAPSNHILDVAPDRSAPLRCIGSQPHWPALWV